MSPSTAHATHPSAWRRTLLELGADRLPHTGRTLCDHLEGTAALLRAWKCAENVCTAGMFHSIYGTDAFASACLDGGDRARLQQLVGAHAERLVYLFSICARPHGLLSAVRTLRVRNRRTGEECAISSGEARSLLAIECANLLEQNPHDGFVAKLAGLPREHLAALVGSRVATGILRLSRPLPERDSPLP